MSLTSEILSDIHPRHLTDELVVPLVPTTSRGWGLSLIFLYTPECLLQCLAHNRDIKMLAQSKKDSKVFLPLSKSECPASCVPAPAVPANCPRVEYLRSV